MPRATTALLAKEVRELLPLWAVAVVGVIAVGLPALATPGAMYGASRAYGLPSAILGMLVSIAMGAMVFGHEFRHKTMAALLTVPISRVHILLVKLAVLGVLLVSLVELAWLMGARTWWLLLPLASGFCLAPWLTLITRSEMAGMVFAGAVPALLILTAELVAEYTYGPALHLRAAAEHLRDQVTAGGIAVASCVGAVATVRRFLSLQQIDGGSPQVLPGVAPVATTPGVRRVRSIWVELLRKELRLQTMPVVLACGMGAVWLAMWALPYEADRYDVVTLATSALQPLCAVLLAILSGALASAEERQTGAWASQVLLPVPMWKQWVVKTAVVLSFALVVGVVLSGALTSSLPWGRRLAWPLNQLRVPVVAVVGAAVSLYVSSLCRRGITAFLLAAGATLVSLLWSVVFMGVIGVYAFYFPRLVLGPTIGIWGVSHGTAQAVAGAMTVFALAAFVGLIGKTALDNHRRLETSARTMVRQVVGIVLVMALGLTINIVGLGFVDAVFWENRAAAAAAAVAAQPGR